MHMGHLVLEPKDVEVLDKDELKTYWITRQCSVGTAALRCRVLPT